MKTVFKISRWAFFCLCGTAFAVLIFWFYVQYFAKAQWTRKLDQKLESVSRKNWFQPSTGACYTDRPVEFYSAPEFLKTGDFLSPVLLEKKLKVRAYRQNRYLNFLNIERLKKGWFVSLKAGGCRRAFPGGEAGPLASSSVACVFWKKDRTLYQALMGEDRLLALKKGAVSQDTLSLQPFLFAQYEGQSPVLKTCLPFEEFPFSCTLAVQVAEDRQFVGHKGVSFKGIFRAMWVNLKSWRFSQGGSTITQQVVKNMFLSSKKSLVRKFKEQILASELEKRFTKEQIFEMYLNIIYMGQRGAFQVRGLAAAAQFYMSKPVQSLNSVECATLAAMIKSPGTYTPFTPEGYKKLLQRRDYILKALPSSKNPEEGEGLKGFSLKTKKPAHPPVYFTDTVYKRMRHLKIPLKEKGLKVFTTLNRDLQNHLDKSLPTALQSLEEEHTLSELQAGLVSVDLRSARVLAVRGGKNFKRSQFNRILQSQRHVGSLMKPVAMLAALTANPRLHPFSPVKDEKWTYTYRNQTWSPKNYNNEYKGDVLLYEVLRDSLNTGMARVSLKTGLKPLSEMIALLGGPKPLNPRPSLILGAFELNTWQVAQMFLTLARMGSYKKMHIINRVESLSGDILYEGHFPSSQVLSAQKAAVVVGMLKEVVRAGTARHLKDFPSALAGKTGTSNEEKDSWFVGFTPEILSAVWLGRDDNRSHGLTGSEGALRVWKNFMSFENKSLKDNEDFPWPRGVIKKPLPLKQTRGDSSGDSLKEEAYLIFEEEDFL